MKWFLNMKIAAKLIAGFLIVALLAGVIGAIGLQNINTISNADKLLYEENTLGIETIGDSAIYYQRIRFNAIKILLFDDIRQQEGFIKEINDNFVKAEEHLKQYEDIITSEEDIKQYNELKSIWEKYKALIGDSVNLVTAGEKVQAENLLLGEGASLGTLLQDNFDILLEDNSLEGKSRAESNTEVARTAIITMIIAVIICMIVAIALGLLISRIISKPIIKLTAATDSLAQGNINVLVDLDTKDEVGNLAKSFNVVINNIKSIMEETGTMVKAAENGRLDIRGNETQFEGAWEAMISGVNRTLDTLVSHIDAMPAPVMIIDKDFTVQYMNKTGADLLGTQQNQLIGTKCYDSFKTADCHTSKCACGRAMQEGQKAASETDAHPRGLTLDISYTGIPIKDASNNIIGAIELVVDQTAIKTAARVAQKQADYQDKEVSKLIVGLDKLSKGNLQLETEVASADNDTKLIYDNFVKINHSLQTSVDALKLMTTDVNALAKAAVEGKLDTRADSAKHEGDFRKIVEGVNGTLDAIIKPINEAAVVMKEMSNGNLHINVEGNYQGDHAIIKDALNSTINAIRGYISEMTQVLTEMSDGNFDIGITGDYKGDFTEIKDSINMVVKSINEVLSNINAASEQVASGSKQMSDSSMALSQGATEQASSIEELTASLEEVSSQTKLNAENAGEANELAETAKANAEHGNRQMQDMLKAMVEINDSSSNISKIIKVIDEIAFQTNILALNAAVEAARAGQHGKGFAVVAEEVRNLAARSANAAKETTDMIEGSIKKTEGGTRIANDTAKALNEIVGNIAKVANLVSDIAIASNEQASGVAQINQGIMQVSQVVQTNSATAEESAAASEELSGQAALLSEMVGKFTLKKGGLKSSKFDELDPEILRMLENMAEKKKSAASTDSQTYAEAAASKSKIALSDKEFGKY